MKKNQSKYIKIQKQNKIVSTVNNLQFALTCFNFFCILVALDFFFIDLTIEETSYQTDNPTILSLSVVLAGLVFVSLVLLLVLFKENMTSCKVKFSSVKVIKY